MRVHQSVHRSFILGRNHRHVAIRARFRIRRIIKRPRSLSRNAARLPVVVLIKSANPSVPVHRHIQMHLVAARTKFRRLFPHKRFQKHAPVRLRIHLHHKIVHRAHNWILARRQFMQLRILQYEIALPHRALHFHDAVAHHAGQSRLRCGRIFNLPDRRIEHSAEKQRRIVAARAPLRTLYTRYVLHVLDALPVPLIVERRKMMSRAVPLLVHIPMAALACLRLHKIFRRNIFSVARLHRAWEEFSTRSVSFSVHRLCRKRRILYAIRVLP